VSRWKFGLLAIKQGLRPSGYVPDTFQEFLAARHLYADRQNYWHRPTHGWFQQWEYVADMNGERICDLLRFESIENDVNNYFGLKQCPLKRTNQNILNRSDYRDYYTSAAMVDSVASWYEQDISRLGFDYDSPARNELAIDISHIAGA
jgi:hypothetical protein